MSIKCDKCKHASIIYQRYSGMHLCKKHFMEDVERKIKLTIRKHYPVKKNETIAVAISGGKDSSVLLYMLHKIFGERPDIRLIALSVDDLDPISALQRSVLFFKDNKASVIGIIGTIISISLALQILGSAVSSVQFLANVWNLVYLFISVFVIRPLTTIWITRMYMARTGKTLYSFDQYLLD